MSLSKLLLKSPRLARIFSAASYRATPPKTQQPPQVTMSLSHILKSRPALSILRNQDGGIFSAFYKATQALQRSFAPEIGGKKGSWFPSISITDALYNDASILLIAFPLCTSSIMLAILARDKYVHEMCVEWCEEDGIALSEKEFEKEFKDRKIYYAQFVSFTRFSPFF